MDPLLVKDKSSKDSKAPNDKERFIYLSGEVDEEKAKEVAEKLLEFQSKDPLDIITIIINSYGGEAHSMFAIIDMMDIITCPVRTIVVGKAMSAAAFILICGEPGMRSMSRNSQLMIHQVSGGTSGTTRDIEIEVEEHKRMQKQAIQEIVDRSSLTYDNVETLIDRDAYITPEKALEFGFCDEIIRRLS